MRRSLKSVNPSRPPAQIFISGLSATLTACGGLVAAWHDFHLSSPPKSLNLSTSHDDFPEAPGQRASFARIELHSSALSPGRTWHRRSTTLF